MHRIQRRLFDQAERQQIISRDWLLDLMAQPPIKPFSKDVLRTIAIEKFGVSKSSFNVGWDLAILQSGKHHWYQPGKRKLPRA